MKKDKTEIVTVRLNPELRFGLELLSRQQHRTLSGVVEWALDQILSRREGFNLDKVWDVDEADRLKKLAEYYPHLLNFDEQKKVKENENH